MATQQDLLPPKDLDSAHGFFKTLPRELRDIIYDAPYQEHLGYFCELGVRISTPILPLRLVNRQFKQEYDEQCAKSERMSQFVLNDETHPKDKRVSEALASRTTNMAVDLKMCFCKYDCICLVQDRLRGTVNRIIEIVEGMPNLHSLRVRLTVSHRRCFSTTWQWTGRYVNLPRLVDLKIVASGHDERVLWVWEEHKGAVEDLEAIMQLWQASTV